MEIPRSLDLGEKFLALKRRLEKQKEQRAELQGELKSLMNQLEQEFGVKTILQAEKKAKKIGEELKELEQTISGQIKEIEEMMEGESR